MYYIYMYKYMYCHSSHASMAKLYGQPGYPAEVGSKHMKEGPKAFQLVPVSCTLYCRVAN